SRFFDERSALVHASSALLDRGRFFFPNVYKETVGQNKPDAFKGIRPEILDLMKLIYELARSIDYKRQDRNESRRAAFVEVKRYFVSAIQSAVDFRDAPMHALKYEQWLGELRIPPLPQWVRDQVASDKTFGNLRFADPGAPTGGQKAA